MKKSIKKQISELEEIVKEANNALNEAIEIGASNPKEQEIIDGLIKISAFMEKDVKEIKEFYIKRRSHLSVSR